MSTSNNQRGSTLVVGLVMLVVLSLLVISAIRSGNINLRIAGNTQIQEEAQAATQQAIEEKISNTYIFYHPSTTIDPVIVNINNTDYEVHLTLTCLRMTTASGYSAQFAGSAPQDSYWDIRATVTDSRTGATVTLHQGVDVRLTAAATCPA